MSSSKLILLFFLVFSSLAGQDDKLNVSITTSPAIELDKMSFIRHFIGRDKDGFIYRTDEFKTFGKRKNIYLNKVGEDLKQLASGKIITEYEGKPMKVHAIFILDDQLFCFTSFYNLKRKQAYLFSHEYDLATLKPKGSLKLISTIQDQFGKFDGNWYFAVSPDKAKATVVTRHYTRNGKGSGKIVSQVFTSGLEQISEQKVEVPGTDKDLRVKKVLLGNEGTVYLSVEEEREESKKKARSYDYALFAVRMNDPTPVRVDFSLPGYRVASSRHHWLEDGSLAICGTYGYLERKGKERTQIIGFYFKSFQGKTLEPLVQIVQPLREKSENYGLELVDNEAAIGDGNLDKLFRFFKFHAVNRNADGSIYLVGAVTYTETRLVNGTNNTTRTQIYSHVKDLQVVKISSKGQAEWIRTIPLHTIGKEKQINDFNLSMIKIDGYRTAFRDGKIYLIFNDLSENAGELDKEPIVFQRVGRDMTIRLLEVSPDGGVNETSVLEWFFKFSLKLKNTYYVGSSYYDAPSGAFLMLFKDDKDYRFNKISF